MPAPGADNPFVSHAFLSALEDSGSAGPRTGWLPQHAVLRTGAGEVVAAAPMYAKSHSYGEYVFDHGWAHAFERARRQLLPEAPGRGAVQPGPRPAPAGPPRRRRRQPGRRWPARWCRPAASSTSPRSTPPSAPRRSGSALGEAGWLQRLGHAVPLGQPGLRELRRLPRRAQLAQAQGAAARAARRQRRRPDLPRAPRRRDRASATGTRSTASTAPPWIANGAAPTSPAQFFTLLGERLGDAVVLMLAENDGRPVAGALNLAGQRHAVRPQLGLPRRLAVPAFRALLLPRDRLRDRARAQARRGRRAGAAQDPARLRASPDLLRPLDRPSRPAPRRRQFPRRGAPGDPGRHGGIGGRVAVPARRRHRLPGARKRSGKTSM